VKNRPALPLCDLCKNILIFFTHNTEVFFALILIEENDYSVKSRLSMQKMKHVLYIPQTLQK